MRRFSTLVTPALFTTAVAVAYGGLILLAGSGNESDASHSTEGTPRFAHRSQEAPGARAGPLSPGAFAFDVMNVRGSQAAVGRAPESAPLRAIRTSAAVREAQQALLRSGFDIGPIDGVVGPRTESALREFQSEHGLTDSGRLNRETLAALGVVVRGGDRSR